MKKMNIMFVMFLLLFSTLALNAAAADVSGVWELTLTTPRGERTMDVTFVQDGENITVTMPGMRGDETEGQGTIQGDAIEWTITRSTPQGEFTVTYTGTVEGDTMSGQAVMGERGSFEWTAKKK